MLQYRVGLFFGAATVAGGEHGYFFMLPYSESQFKVPFLASLRLE